MGASGFIIDSPNVCIETKKTVYPIITAESGTITPSSDSISINGGWSTSPLIEIDTTQGLTISISNAEWTMTNDELTTGGEVTKGNIERTFFGKKYEVKSNAITIPYEVVADSVRIEGLTETKEATPTSGEFKVTSAVDNTTVTFADGEYADNYEIEPIFRSIVENAEVLTVKTTSFPTSGRVIVEFPVYGDKDGDEGVGVKGYVQYTIYKAKIKKDSGEVGGSYKSNQTFNITLEALDPRRADEKFFEKAYFPVA